MNLQYGIALELNTGYGKNSLSPDKFGNPLSLRCLMEITELQEIRPGLKVDIVVATDYRKEISDVRSAVVYDVEDKKIILSQPNPSLTRFYLNRGLVLTYLIDRQENPIRVGVFCKLTDIIPYALASLNKVHAIVLMVKSGAELQNLRMHFRVRPSSDQNMMIFFEGKPMSIIDISIGGAMLSHNAFTGAKHNDMANLLMFIDGERFEIESKIVRTWSPYMDKKPDQEYITVQFLKLDRRLNYLLAGKIFSIQRGSRMES